MLISIPFGFLRTYGPMVWKDINRYQKMATTGNLSPKDEVSLWRYSGLLLRAYTCIPYSRGMSCI